MSRNPIEDQARLNDLAEDIADHQIEALTAAAMGSESGVAVSIANAETKLEEMKGVVEAMEKSDAGE